VTGGKDRAGAAVGFGLAPRQNTNRLAFRGPFDSHAPVIDARYQLVHLQNGATSVRSLEAAETFHPVIGPVAEAEALYVNQLRLRERIRKHDGEFVIWDVGLGAAANTLTVLRATRDLASRLRIVSFDHTPEPLEFALQHAGALGYFGGYENHLQELLRARQVSFQDGPQSVNWEFHLGDFPSVLARALERRLQAAGASSGKPLPPEGGVPNWAESGFGAPPHAILFDAYSPARNPAMWTLPLFTNLFLMLDPQRPCALPTYSRSTILRVTLLLAGFYVGVGHATGEKTETTIAANSLEMLEEPLDRRWLERARRSHSAEPMVEPVYQIAPLSPESWERLQAHPQFLR
jgi:tRNA U34 5-methylaminomethyl-2-thiouridine-forming methyltransferase MnmC